MKPNLPSLSERPTLDEIHPRNRIPKVRLSAACRLAWLSAHAEWRMFAGCTAMSVIA